MTRSVLALGAVIGLGGCELEEMGVFEALDALEQVNRSARGEQATADVIEVSTDFTIGGALEEAAESIAAFWESQAPCSEVTIEGAVATIDYGTLDDNCTWNGHSYAGIDTIAVSSTTPGELAVDHAWNAFTNGEVTVEGDATVTWSGNDWTRHVVTTHSFTDEEGERIDVQGDHITGRIDESVPVWQSGFTLEGTRTWTTEKGDWDLSMEGLELMLIDPAPQTGEIVVTTPSGKDLTVVYGRVDEDTLSATLLGVRGGERVYHINRLGMVSEAE